MSDESTDATLPTFESIEPSPWWESPRSKQFRDIRRVTVHGFALAAGAVLLAIWLDLPHPPWTSEAARLFLGAAGIVLSGTVAWSYDLANKRAGTIDMIASDIISIVRTIVALQVVDDFITMAKGFQAEIDRGSASDTEKQTAHAGGDRKGPGFADTARQSDYFAMFHALIPDLRALDTAPVSDVTAFYTFLKGARDATQSMERWKKDPGYQPTWKIHDIVAIVYAMSLCLVHARRAITYLLRDENRLLAADAIFKDPLIKSVRFLNEALKNEDDVRRAANLARFNELCREDQTSQATVGGKDPVSATSAGGPAAMTPGTP